MRLSTEAALLLFGEYAWLNFPEEFDTRLPGNRQSPVPERAGRQNREKEVKKASARMRESHDHHRKAHAATQTHKPDKRKRRRSTTNKTRRPSSPN